MKIIGNVVGTTLPKPNLKQTDPKKGDYVKGKDLIPTKVSQLENDEGYLTEHQDISGKLDADKLPEAIDTALEQAKASGEFDGKDGEDGYTPVKGKDYTDGAKGEQGYSFVTSVSRPSFTEAQWATYGEIGRSENWSNSSSVRNGCRIGDIFTVVGTATDTKNAHVAYFRCETASGDMRGTCIAHSIAESGGTGDTGPRGMSLLPVTTAPSSYTTEVNGLTPAYRISLSTVKSQASVDAVYAGDTIRYSYYHYPVIYVDSSYVYCRARVSIRGATGAAGAAGSDATVTTESITNALGYTPMNPNEYAVSVKALGAKGDNSTDDTAVFQSALANYRTVYVPGGKYKLSGELVIGSNCQLELAQDAVLYFTQTTGNCISMKMSANIVGNHATISVPYTFSGNVINIDSELNTSITDIPPFTKWDPMWKTARFITDLNIVKPDTRGFYYSMDGTCSGVAVYLRANYDVPSTTSSYIWATNLSKLRIAGAFTYGIFAESFKSGVTDSSGWIHQLKVDGFIDGPEVGLYLKNIEHTYASVLFLPRRAYTTDGKYIPYAKWGICLENSTNTNLLGSRVMDWNSTYSLWEKGNMYQHIALLGNCRDVKLDDFLYYGNPSHDIRDLIYTDTPSNLDSVSILEEPITRWFKPVDGVPYFSDGFAEKRLLLEEEFEDCFQLDRVANFKDYLPTAIDKDGTIFNGIGYIVSGKRWGSSGSLTDTPYYGCTGLIPVKKGDIIHVDGIKLGDGSDTNNNAVILDANFNYVIHGDAKHLVLHTNDYHFGYTDTENGFILELKNVTDITNAAYVAFSFGRTNISDYPVVSVNEPISFSQVGFLADSISVKSENVYGLDTRIEAAITTAIGSAIGGSY